MPGKYDVYVFKDGDTFYVRPAVAMVMRDAGVVKIRNLTDYTVEVGLFAGPHVPILPGANRDIEIPGSANGVYDYSVDVLVGPGPHGPGPHGPGPHDGPDGGLTNRVAAVGNSFPKIIVDP
jgi:hypothetical protein